MTLTRLGVASCLVRSLLGAPLPAFAQTISACGDLAGYSPYFQIDLDSAGKMVKLTGYSVDYLRRLGELMQLPVHIEALPWARCVALGAAGHVDVVLDLIRTPMRDEQFHSVGPYYRLAGFGYLHRTAQALQAPSSGLEFRQLDLCGVLGANYEGLGVSAGSISNLAGNLRQAIRMLRAGRCDALPIGEQHLMQERADAGNDPLADGELAYEPLRYVPAHAVYFSIGRAHPRQEVLREVLRTGIARMQLSDDDAKLAKRYHVQR